MAARREARAALARGEARRPARLGGWPEGLAPSARASPLARPYARWPGTPVMRAPRHAGSG
jgi:hypothetical protein